MEFWEKQIKEELDQIVIMINNLGLKITDITIPVEYKKLKLLHEHIQRTATNTKVVDDFSPNYTAPFKKDEFGVVIRIENLTIKFVIDRNIASFEQIPFESRRRYERPSFEKIHQELTTQPRIGDIVSVYGKFSDGSTYHNSILRDLRGYMFIVKSIQGMDATLVPQMEEGTFFHNKEVNVPLVLINPELRLNKREEDNVS